MWAAPVLSSEAAESQTDRGPSQENAPGLAVSPVEDPYGFDAEADAFFDDEFDLEADAPPGFPDPFEPFNRMALKFNNVLVMPFPDGEDVFSAPADRMQR